jgi:hypothetical protein
VQASAVRSIAILRLHGLGRRDGIGSPSFVTAIQQENSRTFNKNQYGTAVE